MASVTTSEAPPHSSDIVVLGGGPAGAAASRLLASWGYRVRLFTKPADERPLAVSLPPSCAKLFEMIEVAEAIERAGFIRSTGNTVWWGGDARVEPFAGGSRGWQVELGVLEHVLLEEARRVGATVGRRAVTPDDAGVDAAFVLDCTGRAGVIARSRNLRRYDEGPKTIALAGEWRSDRWPVEDGTHTIVESYDDGWMWSVPTSGEIRHVSAMIDPQRSDLARGVASRDVYLAEIAKTRACKRFLANASLVSGPFGFDASPYRSEAYAGEGWLLAGDAGSFIDPLSSAGVKKALASGWLAAIVVNTCLDTPAMSGDAIEFFSMREREIERHYAAASRAYLTAAARGHDRPFWSERAADGDVPAEDLGAVRRALDRIRNAPSFRARAADDISLAPRPYVAGRRILRGTHVISRKDGEVVRYLHNVEIPAVIELSPTVTQVPDLYDAYVRRCGTVSLHDFLAALATAVARGWLVAE